MNTSDSVQWTYSASLDKSSQKSLMQSASKSAQYQPSQKSYKISANKSSAKRKSSEGKAGSQNCHVALVLRRSSIALRFVFPRLTIIIFIGGHECHVSHLVTKPHFPGTLHLSITTEHHYQIPHTRVKDVQKYPTKDVECPYIH